LFNLKIVLVFALVALAISARAQQDLFATEKQESSKGFVISIHGNFDKPAADMAKRFGSSYRFGPGVFYKWRSNWLLGLKGDLMFGNKIKEPGFLDNLNNQNTTRLLNQNGIRRGFSVFERGFTVGVQGGRIFNKILSHSPDNGLIIFTTVGFFQHRILLNDKNGEFPQIAGKYIKGYDRLANGLFVEQFVGYNYISKQGFVAFNIGLNALAGFTQGRRDIWLDTRQPGDDKRLDVLLGIRGSWYIPIFHRRSDELFFE
jgi:hypothetical protein